MEMNQSIWYTDSVLCANNSSWTYYQDILQESQWHQLQFYMFSLLYTIQQSCKIPHLPFVSVHPAVPSAWIIIDEEETWGESGTLPLRGQTLKTKGREAACEQSLITTAIQVLSYLWAEGSECSLWQKRGGFLAALIPWRAAHCLSGPAAAHTSGLNEMREDQR